MATTIADLYAINAFLKREYKGKEDIKQGKSGLRKEIEDTLMLRERYLFTDVMEHYGQNEFILRRKKKGFSIYDVLNFQYKSDAIIIEKKELRDTHDEFMVKNVVNTLREKPYKSLILNLESICL